MTTAWRRGCATVVLIGGLGGLGVLGGPGMTGGLASLAVAQTQRPVVAAADALSPPDRAASSAVQPSRPTLAPLIAADGTTPAPPWRSVGLPGDKTPLTRMDIVQLDRSPVLRLRADRSYGTLVHALTPWLPDAGAQLHWRWRLDEAIAGADLRTKAGDDTALKVCVMFDMLLERIPLVERSLLRLARSLSGQMLPAATVCYVWDATLARDTALPNPYTRRVRYLVLNGADSPPGQWHTHHRTIAADFQRLFGDESPQTPPVIAVAVGADADNTGGRGLGYVRDLRVGP